VAGFLTERFSVSLPKYFRAFRPPELLDFQMPHLAGTLTVRIPPKSSHISIAELRYIYVQNQQPHYEPKDEIYNSNHLTQPSPLKSALRFLTYNMTAYNINLETRLNVVSSGSGTGPTLIFLHYWGGSSRTFAPLISNLPQFPATAIDFRGWGDSTGPHVATEYSNLNLALDVEILVEKLGIHDFILVGHSMGGKVAQLIGGRRRVPGLRAIVLIGPAPPTPLVLPPDIKAQQMIAYDSAESCEFVARNILTSFSLSDEQIKIVVEDNLKGNQFAKLAWPTYAILEDILIETKKIDVPVLVIAGELDKIDPIERHQKEVVDNLSIAEMVVVKGSGHLLPVEAPVQVAKHIAEFVSKLAAV